MTLILTVANSKGVHQSSDYQLTDPTTGASVSDRAGSKQLEASFKGLHLQLAFTGIASGPRGPTIAWLLRELNSLPHNSTFYSICNSLAARCATAMKPLGSRGVLMLVLTVAEVGKAFRVAQISNVSPSDWQTPEANTHFDIQVRTAKRPFHLISGFRKCVPLAERQRLKALARAADRTPEQVRDALTAINATTAQNSGGKVSEGCWVSSQFADGPNRRSASLNVGQHDGVVSSVLRGVDIADWVKKNFQPAPGQKIRLVQTAGGTFGPGGGVPLPPPEGDPKRFTLSGSSIDGLLRSPSGQHCATIRITQLDCDIAIRRNEAVRVPFARVEIRDVHALCADFPRPKFPWPILSPALAIDSIDVPRGWEHSVGYWVKDGLHHVEVPRTSRAIRNLGFLGDDDELVVAPISGAEFVWGQRRVGRPRR
jgi:hypothetical protein